MGKLRCNRRITCGVTNAAAMDRWNTLASKDRLPRAIGQRTGSRTSSARKSASSSGRLAPIRTTVGKMLQGYDIDGDGTIDVREKKISQKLHEIHLDDGHIPTDEELHKIRQMMGRRFFAEEFVARNEGRLWRYGGIFQGRTGKDATDFLATHSNYGKLMPKLELIERQREVRSSRGVRDTFEKFVPENREMQQTWIQTPRKVLKVPKNLLVPASPEAETPNQELGECEPWEDIDDQKEDKSTEVDTSGRPPLSNAKRSQRVAAQAFVERYSGKMHMFRQDFANKPDAEVIESLSMSKTFVADMRKFKAKERLIQRKSSNHVQSCLVDPAVPQYSIVMPRVLTARHVRSQTELHRAKRDLVKQWNGEPHGIEIKHVNLNRSSSAPMLATATVFDNPIPLAPISDLAISKWKDPLCRHKYK